MKGTIACRLAGILLCSPVMLEAQVWDDFSDGDFTNGITWIGESNRFNVAGGMLQLQGSGSDSSFLCTALPAQSGDTMEWSFRLKLNFAPSSLNNSRFYLCADTFNLKTPLLGYFLQYGESGSADAIQLCRQNGYAITVLGRAADSMINSSSDTRVRVIRYGGGFWELWTNYQAGENCTSEFTVYDAGALPDLVMGWKCNYTSSNATAFFLDDVYAGPFRYDTLAPELLQVELAGDTLLLQFSEAPDTLTPDFGAAFRLHTGILPVSRTITNNGRTIRLLFSSTFDPGIPQWLTVQHIRDMAGNSWSDSLQILFFRPATPASGQLLINEIMADPSGAPDLPPVEYFELYNRSSLIMLTTGLILSDGSTDAELPADTLWPGSYSAYCKSGTRAQFTDSLQKQIREMIEFPSFNNDGDNLKLRRSEGTIIDQVKYDPGMYRDPLRDDYGWSLERIDPAFPCFSRDNWRASRSVSGGTPGYINSVMAVFQDTSGIRVDYARLIDSLVLEVNFSEAPDTGDALSPTSYRISKDLDILAVLPDPEYAERVYLQLNRIPTKDQSYVLTLSSQVKDCAGNEAGDRTEAKFGWPGKVLPGSVVLNEILFDPRPGQGDYVEVIKLTEGCILLSELKLATLNPISGLFEEAISFSNSRKMLCDSSYAVAAEMPEELIRSYRCGDERLLNYCALPSMPDEEGTIILLNGALEELDRFSYSDDFHHPLLADREGVALERISAGGKTQDPANWHSASDASGYGTPARKNSQALDESAPKEEWLFTEPQLFSPDNDGYHDVLRITARLPRPGYMARLQVLHENGSLVAELTDNELLEQNNSWVWNGTGSDGELLAPGIYVLCAQFFHIEGDEKQTRKAVVLALKP